MPLQQRQQCGGDVGKHGCIGHHLVADAGEAGNKGADGLLRIYQPLVSADVALFKAQYRHFGNAVLLEMAAGGFQIHHRHRQG